MKKLLLVPILLIAMAGTIAACGSSEDSLEVTDVWTRVTTPTQESGAIYMTIKSPEDDKLLKAVVPTTIAEEAELHETVKSESDAQSGMDDESSHGNMKDEAASDSMDDESAHGSKDDESAHGSMDDESAHGSMDDEHDSMMGMRPVKSIELPAGDEVVLEPGGYHVMIMELVKPIEDGETVPVTLTFEKAGEVQVDATAREG